MCELGNNTSELQEPGSRPPWCHLCDIWYHRFSEGADIWTWHALWWKTSRSKPGFLHRHCTVLGLKLSLR